MERVFVSRWKVRNSFSTNIIEAFIQYFSKIFDYPPKNSSLPPSCKNVRS